MIRFLQNNQFRELDDVDPNMSVLTWLRDRDGKTGTKEGCSSGDCGACTVVLGELDPSSADSTLRYRAINGCITPLGHLHGKQLIVVEDLQQGIELHPVQQAMVDCHGSQCGFCTPGFVMSMFAHHKSHAKPEREAIIESLGGNLCRCTGYRPILDAAVQMYTPAKEDQFDRSEQQTSSELATIRAAGESGSLSGAGRTYMAPRSVEALSQCLIEHPNARLVAGATDLSLEITQALVEVPLLVYTGAVAEMTRCEEQAETIEIGGAATYSDCKALLTQFWPHLGELIERLGSLQVRNQGTIGGNVGNASPIGDMPPVLIVLNAQLLLRRGDQQRTLPIEDFFKGYRKTDLQAGEFIEQIIVPKPEPLQSLRAYKISKRHEDDISAVCAAIKLKIEQGVVAEVDIAFGGMAEIPKRARNCEQALLGKSWTRETIAAGMLALAEDFSPISDFRASASYRMQTAQNLLLRRFLEDEMPISSVRLGHGV